MVFNFRSHYYFAIGLGKYLDFSGNPREIHTGTIPCYSGNQVIDTFVWLRDFHTLSWIIQNTFTSLECQFPFLQLLIVFADSVWSFLRSFATTNRITFVFYSCFYWNVLLRNVPDPFGSIRGISSDEDISFGDPRFKGYLHLTWAYRTLVASFIGSLTK